MDYLEFLYGLKREGIKLGLDVMKAFMERLGNPQNTFRTVHVTGTNGKGSTSALVYNILSERFISGLYTSPHLVRFNERILLQKEYIPDSYVEEFLRKNMPAIEELRNINRNPTFFETTTAMAFSYFAENSAEYASIEVGLGGRLDSTNVVNPEVSVITSVGYEHADKLGSSLDAIAYEKGGIIKPGRPVILGDTKKEVVHTIRRLCTLRNSPLHLVDSEVTFSNISESSAGTRFTLGTEKREYTLESPMVGYFQKQNIATAVMAAELLEDQGVAAKHIATGVKNTVWPARMEILSSKPLIMVDAAHNPPAAHALSHSYRKIFQKRPHLLVGMLKDKDYYSVLRILSEVGDAITLTTPDEPQRALPPERLREFAEKFFSSVDVIEDPREAYLQLRDSGEDLLVTGSIYLVGIIKELERSSIKPYLN